MRHLTDNVTRLSYAGLAAFWLYSGVIKLWSGFDATSFLHAAVEKAQAQPPSVLPFVGRVVSTIALPGLPIINFVIPWIEIAVGAGFLAGVLDRRIRQPTLLLAAILSILFLACGANGWNPFLLGALLCMALAESSRQRVSIDIAA